MKSRTNKILNKDLVVTKSILKSELDKEVKKIDRRFDKIDQRFEKIEVQLDGVTKAIQIIIKELGNMRKENREFYQMREQLYTNDLIQERKLDDHESRLHKLEIA